MKKSEMMLESFLEDIKRLHGRYIGVDGVEPEINYSSEKLGASLTIRYTQRDEKMALKNKAAEAHERARMKSLEREDELKDVDPRLRRAVKACGGFGVATLREVGYRIKRGQRTVRLLAAKNGFDIRNCVIFEKKVAQNERS